MAGAAGGAAAALTGLSAASGGLSEKFTAIVNTASRFVQAFDPAIVAELNRAFAKGLALVANALGIGSQLPTTLKQSLPPPPMGRPESTPLLPQIKRATTENRTAGIIAMVILILQVLLHVVQILTPHP